MHLRPMIVGCPEVSSRLHTLAKRLIYFLPVIIGNLYGRMLVRTA